MNVYEARAERAQRAMAEQGIDWLFVSHSTDLLYMIGFTKQQSERLVLFMLPRTGRPKMVVPGFETAVFQKYASFFDLVGWEETENPVDKVAALVGSSSGKTIAIGDQLHSIFLLRIQQALPDAKYVPGLNILARLRMIKAPDEIANLRAAAEGADRSYEAIFTQALLDMTELDVIRFLHAQLLKNGHQTVGNGIVGAGANGASPHHKTSDRRLQTGDAVVVDFGGGLNGYRSDITRTFQIGTPTEEFREIYEITREAQQLAFEAVKPGVTAESIDAVARGHISKYGYGADFLHRTGHGIGLDGHESPYIIQNDKTVLEPGMTFSIEPGIYLEGKYGVRIEDIVVVTENGADRLNQSPRDLRII
ncbi:MAG TPA: Xaa-Pro peptidase family protein [Phototrophicaceae bacterium]|nr:Xaa-Pro peptidase family protein [Phototrophicaceae bacterium]